MHHSVSSGPLRRSPSPPETDSGNNVLERSHRKSAVRIASRKPNPYRPRKRRLSDTVNAHEELSSTISWSRRTARPYTGRHQRRRKITTETSNHRKRRQQKGRPLVLTFSQRLVTLLPRTGTGRTFHTTIYTW